MGKKDGEARLEIAAEDLSGGGSDDGDGVGDDDDDVGGGDDEHGFMM